MTTFDDGKCLSLDKDGAEVLRAHHYEWSWSNSVWLDQKQCSTCGHVLNLNSDGGARSLQLGSGQEALNF